MGSRAFRLQWFWLWAGLGVFNGKRQQKIDESREDLAGDPSKQGIMLFRAHLLRTEDGVAVLMLHLHEKRFQEGGVYLQVAVEEENVFAFRVLEGRP